MDIITSNDCGLQFGQLRPLTEFDRFGRTFATGRSERQVLALSGILMWERAARFSCWQGLPDRHLLRWPLRRPSGLRLPRRSAARQLRKLGADRSAGYRPCRLQKPEIPQLILSIERPGEPRRALAASGRLSVQVQCSSQGFAPSAQSGSTKSSVPAIGLTVSATRDLSSQMYIAPFALHSI